MRPVTSSIAVSSLVVFFLACGVNLPPIQQIGKDGGDGGPPPAAPKIITRSIPTALEGEDYGAALGASGGAKPLTWSVTQLPPELAWVSLQPDSGVLSGAAPAQSLSASFTVQVADALARVDSVSLTLSVQPCQDGDTRSCSGESGQQCILGKRVCAQGAFGGCSAPDAGTASQDAERCGPDCSDCGIQGGDRCVGGSCVCGDAGTACAPGSTCCGDGCSDLLQANHCHSCDNDCANGRPTNTDMGCGEIDCSYTCAGGYGDCNTDLARDAGDGCETDLLNTVTSCGTCGFDCDQNLTQNVSSAGCSGGGCVTASCSGTFADCDNSWGNGCEIDLAKTETSCGSCGYDCDAHLTTHVADAGCGSSSCHVATCQANYADCDNSWDSGCEVHLPDDPNHCGSCAKACPGPSAGYGNATCTSSTCGISCTSPTTSLCGTKCVNLQSDVHNCGTCGNDCLLKANVAPGGATCSAGTCVVTACDPHWGNCNGNGSDGCEDDLNSDKFNCGACQNACPNASSQWTSCQADQPDGGGSAMCCSVAGCPSNCQPEVCSPAP